MTKGGGESKEDSRLARALEEHKRYAENQAQVKRLVAEAKKEIDLVNWTYPLAFPVTGVFGNLVCVYDQIPTLTEIIDILEDINGRKLDSRAYSGRASTLINFIFWRKMRDSLEELTWEIAELLMFEDIYEGFSAFEALAKRQRIPPRFLDTSKSTADRLRRERWTATIGRGMRGKDRGRRKRAAAAAPTHEKNRLKVLAAVKRVRLKSSEEQDEILNSKAKLARAAGISYHTLRRSEIQGGWTTEGLIAEITPKNVRRADKK